MRTLSWRNAQGYSNTAIAQLENGDPAAGAHAPTAACRNRLRATGVLSAQEKMMAKPPPSGPHSDLDGVNQDARAGMPNRDASKGSAKEKGDAESNSKARPART